MKIDVITIFPEYLEPLRHALLGKAIEQGLLDVSIHNLRDWTHDRHQSVDDSPYGGGPGMVMRPTVWGEALDAVRAGNNGTTLCSAKPHLGSVQSEECRAAPRAAHDPVLIVPTPTGKPFTQAHAERWARESHLVFACGRYEGIDQRVVDEAARSFRIHEVSIGDYVLIGGEVATLVIVEAVVRLIPGVLGNQASYQDDSFTTGLLEGPSYTKPRVWRGHEVPGILLSGHHDNITRWRREQALRRTAERRPDLLETAALTAEDKAVLQRLRRDENN